jgi:hypothetical protein
MTTLQIEVTDEELSQLQQIAREHGFTTPEAYVKSLMLEPTKADILNDVRSGLLAVRRGDPMPTVDDLWAELVDDETTG